MTTIDDLMDWACEHGITRAALETFAREQREAGAQPWVSAIDDRLVALHLGPCGKAESPRDALARMLEWELRIALSPEVSSDAAALVQAGAMAERERCAKLCEDLPPMMTQGVDAWGWPIAVPTPPMRTDFADAIRRSDPTACHEA